MRATVWDPENPKQPLVEGDAEVVEWKNAPEGAPGIRVVFTTQGVPDNDLAQYKERVLSLSLDDGRKARVKVQYVSTLPSGMISTLRVVEGWEK